MVKDKCKVCKIKDATHPGSHIISHFLMNEILADEEHDNRERGILFEMGGYAGAKFEIGQGVLPDRIEDAFNDDIDQTIGRSENISKKANHYCNDCETKVMSAFESTCKKAWNQLKQGNSLSDKDKKNLYGLVLLQLMRAGHVNYHGIELNQNWLNQIEMEVKAALKNEEAEPSFQIQLIKLQKRSKTGGLFVVNSQTKKPVYMILDDVAIAIFSIEETDTAEEYYGVEEHVVLDCAESVINKHLSAAESNVILDKITDQMNKQEKETLEALARECLFALCGIHTIQDNVLSDRIGKVVLKAKSSLLLSREQFIYLFLTMNKYKARDLGVEQKFFGKSVDHYFN